MPDLTTLAADANEHHEAAISTAAKSVEHAWHAGDALIQAKEQCSHGEWLPWLATNFKGSQQSASDYMRLRRKYQSAGNLPDSLRQGVGPALCYTGNTEWYTPAEIISAVVDVMGGIDLDPASCELANRTVQAERFYSERDDGLSQLWSGRVFLNPPFKMPTVEQFAEKLCESHQAGDVSEAVLLINSQTDTDWFQAAARQAQAVTFTDGRIKFYGVDGVGKNPPRGQAFLYFGPNVEKFCEVFGKFGLTIELSGAALAA